MAISWLGPNYLSTVIQQAIINELLAGPVPIENNLLELLQQNVRKT